MATTLLQGGTLLVHDEQMHVHALKADLLVRDGCIAQMADGIQPPPDAKVLDCSGKLLTPGFVDTHHHVWQSTEKGRHDDDTLLEYLPKGLFPGSLHTPDDAFWGELGGALEAIDSGTTTVVDHAHIAYSPEHAYATMRATVLSGLRSFYCYGINVLLDSWKPLRAVQEQPEWIMQTYDKLAATAPFGSGRLQLGFAFDALFLPEEVLKPMFQKVHSSAKLLTHHDTATPMLGKHPPVLDQLLSKNLLGGPAPTILSHTNHVPEPQVPELSRYRVSISTTPTTELSMGMGNPMPLGLNVPELDDHVSLGVDCQSAVSSFMPGQARDLIDAVRAHKHAAAAEKGKFHRTMTSKEPGNDFPTTLRAFNMLTVGGARAVGLEGSIGRLRVGFKADVVVWDATSPGMVCAAEEDPVGAVVMHSSVRDVEGVLIDGVVRKWGGQLVDVRPGDDAVPAPLDSYQLPVGAGTASLAWKDIAQKLLQSRADVIKRERALGLDWKKLEDETMDLMHLDKAAMIE